MVSKIKSIIRHRISGSPTSCLRTIDGESFVTPVNRSKQRTNGLTSPRRSPTSAAGTTANNPYTSSSSSSSSSTSPSTANGGGSSTGTAWNKQPSIGLVLRTVLLCSILSMTIVVVTIMAQPASYQYYYRNIGGSAVEPLSLERIVSGSGVHHQHHLRQMSPQLTVTNNHSPAAVLLLAVSSPRIVFLHSNDFEPPIRSYISKKTVLLDMTSSTSATGTVSVQDDWRSTQNNDQCIPKADWQVASNPNCNTIHEINLHDTHLRVLGEGWFRTTWRYDPPHTNNETSVVLKTLRIVREYISEYYELHRRDAVAMERLTASPFVVNIYAYCGQSAINELADFPYAGVQNLETFNKRMRGNDSPKANIIKLRMATSIALGLADIHAGGTSLNEDDNEEDDPKVYMAHYDLNPRNIALFAGGKPKINDFNIAEFIYTDNITTSRDCKFPSRLHEPWWRAPEEMNTTHTILVNEKVDVYALGNILYHTMTTHSSRGLQTKERMAAVRPIVAAGIRPVIPSHYRHSKDPNIVAMVQAIDLCWEKDSDKRASAAKVATILFDALLKIANPSLSLSPSDTDVATAVNASSANGTTDDVKEDEIASSGEDKGAVAHWDSSSSSSSP